MRRHRHLLATLLVVLYTALSTFGMGFVICVEGDGRRNVEALGAPCCGKGGPLPGDDIGALPTADAAGGDDDCDDCRAHLPACELASRAREACPSRPATAVLPVPPALPPTVAWLPLTGLPAGACEPHPPPPRPSPTVALLRTVVLRC